MLTSNQTQILVTKTPRSETPNTVIFSKPISTNSPVRSVAISQDGCFLAIGYDREVCLHNLLDTEGHVDTISLDKGLEQSIESQRLNFSLDVSKLVLATRDGSGNIEVRLYAHESKAGWSYYCKTQRKGKRVSDLIRYTLVATSQTDKLQSAANDRGLSSVFYDKDTDCVVVTAFTTDPYYMILSNGKGFSYDGSATRQEYKIQAAAQAPSSSTFTTVDTYGDIYWYDIKNCSRVKQQQGLGHRVSGGQDSMMAISMSGDNMAYAFWIGKGEMIFATFRNGKKPLKRNVDIDC
jgi:hypothetical protein